MDVPAEAKALKDELTGMLPFAPIASLLIELDLRTGFLDCLTRAGGRKQARSADLKRNILAVRIASATNLGLVRMAETLPGALRRAGLDAGVVRAGRDPARGQHGVNHHHGLALKVFGGGTMSSSDGQRFPVRKSLTSRKMAVFFADQGLSTTRMCRTSIRRMGPR